MPSLSNPPEMEARIRKVGRLITWAAIFAVVALVSIYFTIHYDGMLEDRAFAATGIKRSEPDTWVYLGFTLTWGCILLSGFLLCRAWANRFPGFLPNRFVLPLFLALGTVSLFLLSLFLFLLMDLMGAYD